VLVLVPLPFSDIKAESHDLRLTHGNNLTENYSYDQQTNVTACSRRLFLETSMTHKAVRSGRAKSIFEELGFPNPEEHLIKAKLVLKIDEILKERCLTQAAAGKILGLGQSDVSKMLRGQYRQFSVDRLLRFLVALDHDVIIVVKQHRSRGAGAALRVA
jgi:predicted XRE-type DNA-binding protein